MQAEVFTKANCPSCVSAKKLLEQRGIAYTEIDAVENREMLIERVTADTGKAPKTVPQVYLDGEHIGGYETLVDHFKVLDFDINNGV